MQLLNVAVIQRKSGGNSEVRGAGRKCKYRRLEIIHLTQSTPEIQTIFSEIQKHRETYIIRVPLSFLLFFFFYFPFPPAPIAHEHIIYILKTNYSVLAYSCLFSYSAYNFSHQHEQLHFQSYQYSNLCSGRLSAVELLCQVLCRTE